VKFSIKSLMGVNPWSTDWQNKLREEVEAAQQGLQVNMVVVVTKESDIYAEILFILTFMGMSIGSLLAFFLRHSPLRFEDLLAFPLAGFALGASLFTLRKFFLHKIANKAVKERVASRAKALFFDHQSHMEGSLVLTYFSELEREVFFLTSPEITSQVPQKEIALHLAELLKNYDSKDPLKSLGPCLKKLGQSLRDHLPKEARSKAFSSRATSQYFLGASDRRSLPLQAPLIKGNKDIN
jgi:uncharacterized membrane protein